MSEYHRTPASGGKYGRGAEERVSTPNADGSTSVLTIGHHTGCHGIWPCDCQPTKIADRHYPASRGHVGH